MSSSTLFRRGAWLVAALISASCATEPVDRIGHVTSAVGEPEDGFPNWSERVIHLLVDRARADPQTELADCSGCPEAACYTPQPPLRWSHELGRSARFHSANQTSCSTMTHTSPCTLVSDIGVLFDPGACDGSASCACQGGTCGCADPSPCTDTWSRIGLFGGSGSGENVASGGANSPQNTFYMWLYENYDKTTCGFDYGPPTNGHRYNILANSGPGLGVGCTGSYCTQDFGGPADAGNKIVVGAHYPKTGTVDFRAHWYDPTGGAPNQAMVNVDGTCHAMTKERGVNDDNATYLFAGLSISSCSHYYFVFKDSSDNWVTYPESGSFTVACATDYDASTRPELGASCDCVADCAGKECGDDGCGGQCPPGCGANQTCTANLCECTGLTCGEECCSGVQTCYADHCCTPDCAGKECGGDGCGGLCGSCDGTLSCGTDGLCGCEGGLTECGTECVNTASDIDHCGDCITACTPPQVCASGGCADSCDPGQDNCDGSCADLTSDPAHCGSCDHACSPGASCLSSVCTCAGGLTDCPSGCVDLTTDPSNCGTCGRACDGCIDGQCPGDGDGDGGTGAGATDLQGGCRTGSGSPGAGAGWLLLTMLALAGGLKRSSGR